MTHEFFIVLSNTLSTFTHLHIYLYKRPTLNSAETIDMQLTIQVYMELNIRVNLSSSVLCSTFQHLVLKSVQIEGSLACFVKEWIPENLEAHDYILFRAKEKVKTLAGLMQDTPSKPADDIVWWAGYLIRTGGARHLRSGALQFYW